MTTPEEDPPEWWKQTLKLRMYPETMTREQYEQEQIATAQSEQAWEANIKEHNRER